MSDSSPIRMLDNGGQIFYCPACRTEHAVNQGGPKWTFNGDMMRPTFQPSIKVTSSYQGAQSVCHFFVRDGSIEYCSDCTHSFANLTVPLPAWPYAPGTYGGVID